MQLLSQIKSMRLRINFNKTIAIMAQEDQLECGTIQSHVSWSGGSERMEGGVNWMAVKIL